jgi:hypothetical protein
MNKNPLERQVLNLPAGYFGMVLGTIGMGFAWRYASTLWPVSRAIGDGLVALATMIWALLTMAFISGRFAFRGACCRRCAIRWPAALSACFPPPRCWWLSVSCPGFVRSRCCCSALAWCCS